MRPGDCGPEMAQLGNQVGVKVIAYDRFRPGVTMETIRPLLPDDRTAACCGVSQILVGDRPED